MNIEPTPEMREQAKIMKRMTLQLKLGFQQLDAQLTAHLENCEGREYHEKLLLQIRATERELEESIDGRTNDLPA